MWKARGLDLTAGPTAQSTCAGIKQLHHLTHNHGQKPPYPAKMAPTTLHAGLEGHAKRKKSFIRIPSRCVKRLRDAYVAWMLSIAGKSNVNLAGVAYSGWPGAGAGQSRYPGRTRRAEKTDEEVACSGVMLPDRSAMKGLGKTRPPPCAKKAVFPL